MWKGGGHAGRSGSTGQPPTVWVSGGDVTLGGLSFTAAYDVHAGSSTVTVSAVRSRASAGQRLDRNGAMLVDGQPFFPIFLWGQCPSYDPLLAIGIDVFMNNPCGGIDAQVSALAGKGLSVAEAPGAAGGVIGSYYPDEADGHGYTGANLPAAQGLRFLTLTNHFYSAAAPLPAGKAMYPGLVAKSDVIGFDLYPLQVWCRRNALPDVAAAQRELVRLAAGQADLPVDRDDPHAVPVRRRFARRDARRRCARRAGSRSSAARHGLGFFPIGWTGDVSGALAQMGHDIESLGPVLLAPAAPVTADAPIEATARSLRRRVLRLRRQSDLRAGDRDDPRARARRPGAPGASARAAR